MKKLILHIGSHKTGSSAIQHALLNNLDILGSHGWTLFYSRPEDGSLAVYGNANSWVDFTGQKESFKAVVKKSLVDALEKTKGNIIISSEELSWLTDKEDINWLIISLREIFDDIQVVCYIRRQDRQLLSHYQQGFRYPHSSASRFFGDDLCIVPKHKGYYKNYLDYSHKLAFWAEAVGFSNLKVKEFDTKVLIGGDAVKDFMAFLEIPFDYLGSKRKEIANDSLNITQLIINKTVFDVRKELWYELGRRKFTNSAAFSNARMPKITATESHAIMSHYYKANEKLKLYIPELSSGWLKEGLIVDESYEASTPITEEDYLQAIQSLVRYYDDLSILDFAKIKYRHVRDKIGFKPFIR